MYAKSLASGVIRYQTVNLTYRRTLVKIAAQAVDLSPWFYLLLMKMLKTLRDYMNPHNKNARRLERVANKAAKDNLTVLPQTLRDIANDLRRNA